MKKYLIHASASIACLFVVLFSSCSGTKSKKVDPAFSQFIAAYSSGSVSSNSPIMIELVQDVPAVEEGKEIKENLFEFSPAIKGKSYWVNSRTIKFVPEDGQLKNGQKYDAWFKLGKVQKVKSKFDEFYFFFDVPKQDYQVDLLPYSPTKDNDVTWNTITGTLTLADDAPLDKISKMFSVSGSSTAKISVAATFQKGTYALTIDSLKRETNETKYELIVDGKPLGIDRPAEHISMVIPQLDQSNHFSVVDTRTISAPQRCIRITFSEQLSLSQNIQGLVSTTGNTNFSYNVEKNVLTLFLQENSDDDGNDNLNIGLNIAKSLRSISGKSLDKAYTYNLVLEGSKPQIKITNSVGILPNSKNLNIPFMAINLWAVDVTVTKIFQNNILGYLQYNNFGETSQLQRFGRVVIKKRIRLDMDKSKHLDQWNTFALDMSSLIQREPGAIYKVDFSMDKSYSLYPCGGQIPQIPQTDKLERFSNQMTDEEDQSLNDPTDAYSEDEYDSYDGDYNWAERTDPCKDSYYRNKVETAIILSSDIGITAQLGTDKKMQVALSDIMTTQAIGSASVEVYNYQMQRIGSAQTDANGFATIPYKGGVPFAIIASRGNERGYLKVNANAALSLSNFDVSGKELKKGLNGYIYGERGVWRPGDTIYLTFILEDKDQVLPAGHPVSLNLYNPQGQLAQKLVTTTNENGFYTFQPKTDADAPTGNWRAVVKVGGTTFTKNLRIETIKPNRLKIRLDLGTVIDASVGKLQGSLSSQWLQGSPAANLKANIEMRLSRVYSPFSNYSDYVFSNPISNFTPDTYTIFDGTLDATGNSPVNGALPPAENAPGMLMASILSRVYEPGGDASVYSQSVRYSPYATYVGIKTSTDDYGSSLETDKDNPLNIVTVNKDGKLKDCKKVHVKIYKLKWSWWWNRNSGDLASYVNNTAAEVILDKTVSTLNGKATVNFKVLYPNFGRYLVMATDEDGGHVTGKIVYVDWPSSRGYSQKEDPSGVTMLSFTTDKKSYKVGDKATVIIPKSSDGRALISLESGTKILTRNWVETSAKQDTKYTFEVTSDMAPNFYVFASLLQPHAQTNNDSPLRMYGVLNIGVDNKNTVLTPVIKMADELRPEKEFTVAVSEKNKKKMTYTLAIVDDGLLDITGFKTPNAWSEFYTRQALGINTWDMFDQVIGASTGKLGPLLSIGGDEDEKSPTGTVSRFKPIVKYLGPFTIDAGETKTHQVKLPSYIGSVRVMVVAGSQDGSYGSSEKTVPVKNPLMILSTLPRVAGPDEDILLPVNVFATDKKIKNVTVTLQTKGLLKPMDGTSKSITFTEVGDQMVYFKLKADKRIGAEKVELKATGGGEVSTETIDIAVRNPNPAVIVSTDELIPSGSTKEMNLPMDVPQDGDWVRMEISRMPSVNLNRNLHYLMDYPHGCSEQVTSRAFPALYVGIFHKYTDVENNKMKENINDAIRIISSRQLSGGGIAYWPGQAHPTEWVSSYAGHFLLEAKRQGYSVPESVISNWIKFQTRSAQEWAWTSLYKSYYTFAMFDLEQAYRLYTLALAGQPDLGAMNRMRELKNLSVQTKWQLAAAYAIAGKKTAAQQIINNTPDIIPTYSWCNDSYGSSERDMAMIMHTELLLGDVPKALKLAAKVSEGLNSDYITTQTASFGLIAMAELAEKMGTGVIGYSWELNGEKQPSQNIGEQFQEITIKPTGKIKINFTNTGQGQLYVKLVGSTKPLVDKTPASEIKTGLNIYVKYQDKDKNNISVSSLKQGTEFYADVVAQNSSNEYLTDLALSQIFPSGWEIFNNRLLNTDGADSDGFEYQDIRDDRVLTYFSLSHGSSEHFRVRLQAAYCGRFFLPATICEAMYKPDSQARSSGQWVEVIQ